MTNTSQNHEKTYFNLHVSGVGYLSRIRTVTPKKGDAFLCCQIAALVGSSDNVEYRYLDLRVVGEEAKSLVARCENAVNDKRKVIVGFRLGDLWVDEFIRTKGANQGKSGYSLKGRLLKINWIKIDGVMVHAPEAQTQEEQQEESGTDMQMPASPPNDVPHNDEFDTAQALHNSQTQVPKTPESTTQAPQKELTNSF